MAGCQTIAGMTRLNRTPPVPVGEMAVVLTAAQRLFAHRRQSDLCQRLPCSLDFIGLRTRAT